jgi:tRNA 2-thiouridine synthesizing protein A
MADQMNTKQVNARNLLCPMPVIRLQNAVKDCKQGDLVEIVCTDPGAMSDIPAWCRINKHELVNSKEHDGEYIFTVKTGAPD